MRIRKTEGSFSGRARSRGDGAAVKSQRSAEGTDPRQSECQQWIAASAAWLTQAFLCLLAELNNPLRHNINTHTRSPLNIQLALQVLRGANQVSVKSVTP